MNDIPYKSEDVLALWRRRTHTYDQIAEQLGISRSTVSGVIHRHLHRDRHLGTSEYYFDLEAAARNLSRRKLIIRLLRRIAADDLCKAILDD